MLRSVGPEFVSSLVPGNLRPPIVVLFSANNETTTVTHGTRHQSKMHPVLKRKIEIFSAYDWLAALTAHIPNTGEYLVRYSGWYSNVKRGKRQKTQAEDRLSGSTGVIEECSEVSNGAAKRAWARLIKQVYEVDPLVCLRCGSAMRVIAFIEQPAVIEKILSHLGLWPILAHSPPTASVAA